MGARAACHIADVLHELLKALRSEKNQHPRARNDYDEETAFESYMNPEPGFQSGSGDSTNAD